MYLLHTGLDISPLLLFLLSFIGDRREKDITYVHKRERESSIHVFFCNWYITIKYC